MRILLTADPALPVPPKLYGGIERIIASLVTELLGRGHEVGLLAHRESECETTVRFTWPTNTSLLSHLQTLRGAVRTFEPEVVHSFSRLAYLLPVLSDRAIPKIMSFQREPTDRTVRWANRLARGSLTFTGCSDYISGRGRAIAGDWTTIHNFVDTARFEFVPSVPEDAPLVFLSRIEPIKGCHTAIAIAKASGRRLLIAGNRVETGSAAGYWANEIAPHLDRDGIEYVGPVNDEQKNALLGQATALVVPIEWDEPFGIVFVEALACGTPVISCPRGALPEIVRDGQEGFLCESAGELVGAVAGLGKIDRTACRARAADSFSVEAIVPRYEALYRSKIE